MKTVFGDRTGDDLLLAELERREDYVHEAASSIDTKASQIFAAAALLAVEPAVILVATGIKYWVMDFQAATCVALLISAIYAHQALKVAAYPSPPGDEQWRIDELVRFDGRFPTASQEDREAWLRWGLLIGTRERGEEGKRINASKEKLLGVARGFLLAAMILNMLSLLTIFTHRFF